MAITTLATELVLVLTSYLSRQDCKNLRLCCKQLSQYVAVGLLRSIVIDVKRQTHAASADQLRLLARQQAPVEVVQRLVIKSLSPQYDSDTRRPTQKNPRYASYSQARISESETGVTEEVVYRFLKDALTALQNVHTIVVLFTVFDSWNPQGADALLSHQIVLSALSNLPQLRHLEVNVTHCKVPLDFCAFTGVQSIKYKGISQRFYEDNMKSVNQALCQLPHLNSLDMECASHPSKPALDIQNVHYLFSGSDSKRNIPKLRHLGLWFYLIRLDHITLPHFSSLTSLELRNTNDPRLISIGYKADPQEPLYCNSRIDDIWLALAHQRVRLEKISVDFIVPTFLDYLQSYTGLRSLVLSPRVSNGESSAELATRFFQESLSAHAATLQHVAIKAVEEGPWCFNEEKRSQIGQCQNLISLHVAVESPQMTALLITLALKSLHQLSEMYIKATIPNELRGGRRIATIEHHLNITEGVIMQSLMDCILPPTYGSTPMVCICIHQGHDKSASPKERWFKTRHGPHNTLRYVECEYNH